MNILDVNNISKSFGSSIALNNVSFSLKESEILGVLGPNGSGKTTTINCIMDFITPNSGFIKIFDKIITSHSDINIKKDLSYASSESILNEEWTALEYINFIYKFKNKSNYDKDIIEALDVPMTSKIKKLSYGNKQKVALIIALICSPKLIILDEPSRGLDPVVTQKFHEILINLKNKGTSILLSSHDLSEVNKVADRVVIIKDGSSIKIENIRDLEDKTIYSVSIDFNDKYNIKDFEKFIITSRNDKQINLKIKSDINSLIKILLKYDISNISIDHATLEDIFLEYYK